MYDDVRSMKYLRAFLNGKCLIMTARKSVLMWLFAETLRLYPPV